jgi:hypothetical protein
MTPSKEHIGKRVKWAYGNEIGFGILNTIDDRDPRFLVEREDWEYRGEGFNNYWVNSYELMEKTLDNLEGGEILKGKGCYQKVLGVLKDLVFLSGSWTVKSEAENDGCGSYHYTVQYLKNSGYTLVDSEDQKAKEAMEYLEKVGKIKEGKILS